MKSNVNQSNFKDPDLNPCLKESDLVRKCLETNFYVQSKCSKYFQNYKECKKFWGAIRKSRMRAGITPDLPPENERETILKQQKKGTHSFSEKNDAV